MRFQLVTSEIHNVLKAACFCKFLFLVFLSRFKWTIYVRPLVDGFVTRVTFELHPTFQPKIISLVDAPFELETNWLGVNLQLK